MQQPGHFLGSALGSPEQRLLVGGLDHREIGLVGVAGAGQGQDFPAGIDIRRRHQALSIGVGRAGVGQGQHRGRYRPVTGDDTAAGPGDGAGAQRLIGGGLAGGQAAVGGGEGAGAALIGQIGSRDRDTVALGERARKGDGSGGDHGGEPSGLGILNPSSPHGPTNVFSVI